MKALSKLWIHEQMQAIDLLKVRGRRSLACYSNSYSGFKGGNQDCMGYTEDARSQILVVADGAGGMAKGERASKHVTEAILRAIGKKTDLASTIIETALRCQETLARWVPPSGTTLTVAEIQKNRVRAFHCGDSELLLLSPAGAVLYQTISHSPTGYLQAAGMLSSTQALSHPDRTYISNYVGTEQNFFLQVSPWLDFKKGSCLILGSDGLFDNLSLTQIRKAATNNTSALLIAEALVTRATRQMDRAIQKKSRQGKADDLSVMVLKKD